jgi:CHAT domain-containing protein
LATISQAASARMLCDSADRTPVPPSPVGLVVADPEVPDPVRDLVAARIEAEAVHRAFYRGGRYVGRRADGSTSRSGSGTAAEVREWLVNSGPGAGATLHLACHGFVDLEQATSYLLLAPDLPAPDEPAPNEPAPDEPAADGRLRAADLIDLLATAPGRAIGLVVLAACRTGLAINGYDEAYSLGTALLAAGVRSVLSTQWSIPDVDTSVLMFMFHHYRMADRLPVREALQRAQVWMLDPHRELPPTMPQALRAHLATIDPTRVGAWAGFVHWGR